MTTASNSRPRVKPEIVIDSSRGDAGAQIHVTVSNPGSSKNQVSEYWAERVGSASDVTVRFFKIYDGRLRDFAAEVYLVRLDPRRHVHECECKGFLYHRHCRHVDAAIELFDAGLLVLPPRPEQVEERPAQIDGQEPRLCETCGYCGGSGRIVGSMYDAWGCQIADEPPREVCEYCDGAGMCVDGDLLLPARQH